METPFNQISGVEVIETRIAYQGFLSVLSVRLRHRLFNGEMSGVIRREVLERGQAVAVVLYDRQRDAVVMVEQFRIGAVADEKGAWLLELVAGMVESGELPAEVARRESLEEAGCLIDEPQWLGRFYLSPGGCTEQIQLYYAEIDSSGLAGSIAGVADEAEDIRVHVIPWQQIQQRMEGGEIINATTLIGLQWLQIRKLQGLL